MSSVLWFVLILSHDVIHYTLGIEVIYPNEVCVNGDVQADYETARDPRTLMGTYTKLNMSGLTFDESIVDISAPIYQHEYEGVGTSGWSLSETLPLTCQAVVVFLTCFEDNLFDCQYYKWWWGYNKYEYSIPFLKVMGNECNSMFLFPFP